MTNPLNQSQLVVPGTESVDLMTTLVKVNGRPLPDVAAVQQIRISRCANRIPFAQLSFIDGDAATQRFDISDTDLLSPGHPIEIYAGYHGRNEVVFKGIIVKHALKVMQSGQISINLECKDEAVKLTVGRRNKYFYEQSDSDIINEVLRGRDLAADVEDTVGVHREMVQYNATDWDFLVTRAEANAMLVLVKDGRVAVKKPDFEQDALFPLQFGASLFEFEGEMDARDQYPTVKVSVWNPDSQAVEESEPEGGGGLGISSPAPAAVPAARRVGDAPGLNLPDTPANTDYTTVMGLSHWPLRHTGGLKSEEAQQWAKAQQTKADLAKKQGRVKFQGVANVYPGDVIELVNVGSRHSGKVYVTAVTHEIAEGMWYAHVQFGLPQRWFVQEYDDVQQPPAAALTPAVHGLQIGVVTALENDPENAHRIQVRLPLLDNRGEGSWMRIACQDAGNNRGAFWRPEVGDEVVVGFLDDDPRHPVVLGMLNSTAKPAALTANDDNHQKGWVTRSGMRWIFDDEKKSMTLETPGGKKLVVDEDAGEMRLEDENGNKIILDSNGITLDSAKDLIFKAAQNVTLEGVSVSHKAQSELSLEGQGKAQLSASGEVVIRGSFVRIN